MAIHYLSGPCMYARIFEGTRDMEGYEGKHLPYDGAYEILVGVPEYGPEYKMIMGWNRMYAPKIGGKDKGFELERGAVEGLAYFRFNRKHDPKKANPKANARWGGPPSVIAADTPPVDWNDEVAIGNGSLVTLKIDVENLKSNPKINFVRLEAVRVDEHVPYEPDTGEAKTESEPTPDNFGDEIPF